eukprot:TRINITY_DN3726_c0_g1_i2.p1 TRINITY_DN3726_c0_g1~~TRINITY_DN3726_c0_g1_i2.p1  ORF type:complete len:275 (+),score=-13.32 TRINITY_DN3726_c0_g1_i2:1094-1918(+)
MQQSTTLSQHKGHLIIRLLWVLTEINHYRLKQYQQEFQQTQFSTQNSRSKQTRYQKYKVELLFLRLVYTANKNTLNVMNRSDLEPLQNHLNACNMQAKKDTHQFGLTFTKTDCFPESSPKSLQYKIDCYNKGHIFKCPLRNSTVVHSQQTGRFQESIRSDHCNINRISTCANYRGCCFERPKKEFKLYIYKFSVCNFMNLIRYDLIKKFWTCSTFQSLICACIVNQPEKSQCIFEMARYQKNLPGNKDHTIESTLHTQVKYFQLGKLTKAFDMA